MRNYMKLYRKLIASTLLLSMAGVPACAQKLGIFNELVGGVSMRRIRANNLFLSAQLKKSMTPHIINPVLPAQVTPATTRARSLNNVFQKHLALPGNAVTLSLPKMPDVRLITLRITEDIYVEQDNIFLAKGSIVVQLPNGDFRFFTKEAPAADGFLEQVALAREQAGAFDERGVQEGINQQEKLAKLNKQIERISFENALKQQIAMNKTRPVTAEGLAFHSPTPAQLRAQFNTYVTKMDQLRNEHAYDKYWVGDFGGKMEYVSWEKLEADLKRFYKSKLVPRVYYSDYNVTGMVYVIPVEGLSYKAGSVLVNLKADLYLVLVTSKRHIFIPRNALDNYTHTFKLVP